MSVSHLIFSLILSLSWFALVSLFGIWLLFDGRKFASFSNTKHLGFFIILFVVFALLIYHSAKPLDNNWTELVGGLITEAVGMMFTFMVVEEIVRKENDKDELRLAKKEISRINQVLSIYLRKLALYIHMLTVPIMQRDSGPIDYSTRLEEDFDFRNLSDVFQPAFTNSDSYESLVVERYFETQKEISNTVASIVYNIDMTKFPELSNLLVQYLEETETSSSLLNLIIFHHKNEGFKDLIIRSIKNFNRPIKEDGMITDPYIRLYYLLQFHIRFLKYYETLIRQTIID